MQDCVATVKELESYQQLQSARQWVWGWIAFLSLYLLIWQWPSLTMVPLRHTFLLSSPNPGTLLSDWWSLDHFITLFVLLLWLVPLTLAFACDAPLTQWRRILHMIVTFLLFLLALAIMVWWTVQYEAANDATASNSNNPANDPRWCCVNFVLDAQRCAPLSATHLCSPSPGQSDLVVAPMFLYRYWFLVVFVLLLLLDFFVIVKGIFERAVARYSRVMLGMTAADDDNQESAAPAGVFRFRVPVSPQPSAPSKDDLEEKGSPPSYNSKGQPYCPTSTKAPISMKEQLRAAAARQQQLKESGNARYFGKNSKR